MVSADDPAPDGDVAPLVRDDEAMAFADALAAAGDPTTADAVREAIRGGSTGGEILTNLGVVLSGFLAQPAPPELRAEASRLLTVVDAALRRAGQAPPAR